MTPTGPANAPARFPFSIPLPRERARSWANRIQDGLDAGRIPPNEAQEARRLLAQLHRALGEGATGEGVA